MIYETELVAKLRGAARNFGSGQPVNVLFEDVALLFFLAAEEIERLQTAISFLQRSNDPGNAEAVMD